MKPRLQEHYETTLRQSLQENFAYANPLQVPRLEKIVVNMGVGDAAQDSKRLTAAQRDLAAITGQKPLITRARKSNAGFKIRTGFPIGCKVTLRRERMYEFLDRLVTMALPRQRDFRGIKPSSFDGQGNLAFGLREQIVFPEVDYDRIDRVRGMDIMIATTAKTDNEAKALLRGFDVPFRS